MAVTLSHQGYIKRMAVDTFRAQNRGGRGVSGGTTREEIRAAVLRLTLAALAFAATLATPLRAEIAIQEVTSPGGIKAWLVEDPNIPFMALEIRFRGGTSLDQPGKRGAVNLMAATLEEGAGDLDAQGFAAARDGLAAQIGFGMRK